VHLITNFMSEYIDDLLEKFQYLVSKFIKFGLHIWTKCSEIERICSSGGYHTFNMSFQLARSIKKSRKLEATSRSLFYPHVFEVSSAFEDITRVKGIATHDIDGSSTVRMRIVSLNLMHCLNSLKHVNDVISHVEEMLQVEVRITDEKHAALLSEFWFLMRPGVKRLRDEDWAELGFQGTNPSTDFRGMGLFGLHQLVYLAKESETASMLLDSGHPLRYYPFACVGINISAFTVELLRGRHLHLHLLRNLESISTSVIQEGADANGSEWLVLAGYVAVHLIYCDIFELFSATWRLRNPPNVMHFQEIFTEVKAEIKKKYPCI
jgi:ELMO domain-containing protein